MVIDVPDLDAPNSFARVTAITSLAAYQVTAYTFRKGDDPDNVVIPIITSTMDAVGTALVVMLFMALVF